MSGRANPSGRPGAKTGGIGPRFAERARCSRDPAAVCYRVATDGQPAETGFNPWH